jgi:FG-GAP-like repeat/PASTA domain
VRAALVAVVTLLALVSSAGAGGLGGSSGPSFGRARAYATGHPAAAVAVGDLTGDAKPDLVSANGSRTHTVSVLINKGNGSFRAKREFGTGRGPESVVIGDLNADGNRDIATANQGANTVSVLFNNGDGGLRPKRDYATGRGTRSVAIDDVNGDGQPDLVTVNTGESNGISVLLNTGDGTFQAKRDFGPGLSPLDLAIGDLNGDSKADLATVNENYVNGNLGLTVFLNAGDGTFPAMREYGTFEPHSIEIGDVSGDGKADLLVTYSHKESGPGVIAYLNRGHGRFRAGVYHSVHGDWATGGSSVAIGDLNGDRKADLAVTSRLHAVSVLVNLGDGRFQRQLDYGTGYPGALAIDDLNGDRRRDLVVMNYSTISVLLNKPGLCNVQELRRQTLKTARQTLARVNCRVGKVSYAYSRTIRGLVIRQKPTLGAVLRGGSAVDVVVSRGGKPS